MEFVNEKFICDELVFKGSSIDEMIKYTTDTMSRELLNEAGNTICNNTCIVEYTTNTNAESNINAHKVECRLKVTPITTCKDCWEFGDERFVGSVHRCHYLQINVTENDYCSFAHPKYNKVQ